jgi:hypothetical protein
MRRERHSHCLASECRSSARGALWWSQRAIGRCWRSGLAALSQRRAGVVVAPDAAALIDPLTAGPPDRDGWLAHECRVRIDLRRGDFAAAAERWQANTEVAGRGMVDWILQAALDAADLALWTGRPADALEEARRGLALFTVPDQTPWYADLLTQGLRACADLAEQARARRDQDAASAAIAAADGLADWVKQMHGIPLASHPAIAWIPAVRAVWDAEQTRLAGASDPAAWNTAASAWDDLGCPHDAGYARWRQAEAHLAAGHRTAAATALRDAAAADGHAPLQAKIRLYPPGRHPQQVAGRDHRRQRPLGPPPVLQELREIAALAQPGDRQLDRPGPGVPLPYPVAVPAVHPLRCHFPVPGVTADLDVGVHHPLREALDHLPEHVRAGSFQGLLEPVAHGRHNVTCGHLVLLRLVEQFEGSRGGRLTSRRHAPQGRTGHN